MNWVAPIKDDETLRKFEKKLKEIDDKYYIMFEIGVGTGMQVQDILNLKVGDIRGKDVITTEIGASQTEHSFDVPEDLKDLIAEYTDGREEDAYLISGKKDGSEPLSREQAYRAMKNAGKSIGLTSIGAQTMRKTWAWRYYKKTGDITYIQRTLSHASPSITYRYIGEKPNIEIQIGKMTSDENERCRYTLLKDESGKKRIQDLITQLEELSSGLDDPTNTDSFYGYANCIISSFEETFRSVSLKK